MSTIHVCLISDQPIPNLLPLLFEKPERAIFLVSPQKRDQAERLKNIVRPRNIKVEIKELASAYDFEAIQQVCSHFASENPDDHITLNVTGGTKITALAAFQAFYFNNQRIIYLDTTNQQLLQLAPEVTAVPMQDNLIKVHDYLLAYGMNPLPANSSAIGQRRPELNNLAELFINDTNLLSRFNIAIDRACGGKNPSSLNIDLNGAGEGSDKLAAALAQTGASDWTTSTNLHIPTPEDIFFCNGGWLEEFTYWAIRNLSIKHLDAAINIRVQWDGKGNQITENEFDILFTHDNRLHLISCKASNPGRETTSGTKATEALNELDTLADRAGGLFGRAMLVSARKLRKEDRERAKKMRIELVDGTELLRLQHHLRAWLAPRKAD